MLGRRVQREHTEELELAHQRGREQRSPPRVLLRSDAAQTLPAHTERTWQGPGRPRGQMTADTLDRVFRARWSRSTWLGTRKVYVWGIKDNAQFRFRGFGTSDTKFLLPARYMNGDTQGAQYEGTASPSPVGGDARKGLTVGRARGSTAASGPCTVEAACGLPCL